jgi:hypothetical protein
MPIEFLGCLAPVFSGAIFVFGHLRERFGN